MKETLKYIFFGLPILGIILGTAYVLYTNWLGTLVIVGAFWAFGYILCSFEWYISKYKKHKIKKTLKNWAELRINAKKK